MAEPGDRILAARSAQWLLGRHIDSQLAGWALWPRPYGPVRDQDSSKCSCPLIYGLDAPAYRPVLYLYIPSAHS